MTAEKTKKKSTWGGRREGAGRKKGSTNGGVPLSVHLSFRVSEDTMRRVRSLRELTKEDTLPFNRMFELWVADLARDYGVD